MSTPSEDSAHAILEASRRVVVNQDPHAHERSKRMKYDPTITLGNVISAMGFIAAATTGWITLDRRVTVVEEKLGTVIQVSAERSTSTTRELEGTRADVKELTRTVDRFIGTQKSRP